MPQAASCTRQARAELLRWVLPLCAYLLLLFVALWFDRAAIYVRRVPWWMEDEAPVTCSL